jgi:AcrR family transcriptional regulator
MTDTGTPRRRRAPRGQGDRLRDEILAAADRLLRETGDQEAVSIRAVADAVGVTPPSIYLHFADKCDLMFAICQKHFAELDRTLREAAAGSRDPLESLRLRARAYVHFGIDHPEEYRILFLTRPAATPEGWSEARVKQSASFHHLVEAVQAALDAGAIRAANPVLVAFGLWAAVHGLTSLFVAKPGLFDPDHADRSDRSDREALIEHVLDVQLRGLGPPDQLVFNQIVLDKLDEPGKDLSDWLAQHGVGIRVERRGLGVEDHKAGAGLHGDLR